MKNIFQLFPAKNKDFVLLCKKDVALTRIKAQNRAASNLIKKHKLKAKKAQYIFFLTQAAH